MQSFTARTPQGVLRNSSTTCRRSRRQQRVNRAASAVVETLEERRLLTAFTVTNTNDSGVGSLRFEIDAANHTPAVADTITFNLPAGDTTISLLADDTNHPFAFGPTALVITSPITIVADPTKPGVTLDALGVHRLFAVSSTGSLTLQNVTLTHGVAQGGAGGDATAGIAFGGGGGAGLGGAIFNAGTLVVQNSTLVDNLAAGGAGGSANQDMSLRAGGGGGGSGAFKGGNFGGLVMGAAAGGGGGGVAGPGSDNAGSTGGAGGPNENSTSAAADTDGASGGGGGGASGANAGGSGASSSSGGFGGGGGGGGGSGGATGGPGGFAAGGGGGNSGGVAGFGGGGGGGVNAGLGKLLGGNGGSGALTDGGGGGSGFGGAIFNNGGTVSIVNSTITGNLAQGGAGGKSSDGGSANGDDGRSQGSGIFTRNGFVTIDNSTLYLNPQGVFVLSDGGATVKVTMDNSIVSNNSQNGDGDFVTATANSSVYLLLGANNLIENNFDFPLTGVVSTADPMLGPLASNGGPTQTHALLAGSPAIDAGSNDFVTPGSEAQTVTVGGSSGTFMLTFIGPDSTGTFVSDATIPLDVNSPTLATDMQNALDALSNIGGVGGSVSVPSPVGNVYTVTFGGSLANQDLAQISSADSGGVTTMIATSRNGNPFTLSTDQRGPGFPRVVNNIVDIGAYEAGAVTVTVTPAGVTFSGTEGRQFNKTVATFTSSNPSDVIGNYSVSINWGDGKTGGGTIVNDGGGNFHVTAMHRYAEQSSSAGYPVKVTIHRTGGGNVVASSVAKIADAILDQAKGLTVTKSVNVAFTNLTLGSFRDQDSLNTTAADYTGTIDWGDGTAKTAAKFVFTGSTLDVGSFWNVQGSHKYTTRKTFTVKITLHDSGANLIITAFVKVV